MNLAKVSANGQITLPVEIRRHLGLKPGDKVLFVVEGGTVRMVNSAVYAMQALQAEMRGMTECADLNSEKDVIALVKKTRADHEIHNKLQEAEKEAELTSKRYSSKEVLQAVQKATKEKEPQP